MSRPFKMLLLLGLNGILLIGCTAMGDSTALATGTNPDHRGGAAPESPRMAIVDYSTMDLSDQEMLAQYARAGIIVTETSAIWCSAQNEGKVADLKSLNPSLKLVGYVNAHGSWLAWGDQPERDPLTNSYGWDWYNATKPYWSYTTTGDTMMAWEGQVLLNILNPDCRSAMIQVLADHWHAHSNVLDGVFWDHFNQFLWVPTDLAGVNGQLDLDGNGIAHRDDEEEMRAYRLASEALITGLREALGSNIVQIVNGNRAATDSVFTGLVDGMMYEHFPEVGFWGQRMQQALDPAVPHNLFAAINWPRTENGGPWLILANKYRFSFQDDFGASVNYRRAEFSRVAAALTGCYVTYHSDDQKMHYGWPEVDLNLGQPVGKAVFADGEISRDFEYGQVSLQMTHGDGSLPFDFEIHENGKLVQALAFPTHFP